MSKSLPSVVEKFLRYVKIDTQSVHNVPTVPSTEKQKDLGRLLMEELEALGAQDIRMDDHGCVYATIPANCETDAPVVGFLAHMDTTPDVSGTNVNPRIVENYDGGDIVLNEELGIVMRTQVFDNMLNYVGQDFIVTDGTTLLGADDKAGVAEIMYMAEYLLTHPEVKHGTIKVGFTTDEEVGCPGAKVFDIEYFGADFAFTLDGHSVGEYNCESFNAADAFITVHGRQVHPGRAKNKMINAIIVAKEFDNLIPSFDTCEHVDRREGYFHITNFDGTVPLTKMKYLVRDFDMDGFNNRKEFLRRIGDYLNGVYGEGTVEVEFKDTYFSMYEAIKSNPAITEHALKAITDAGVTPRVEAVRGGTDGSVLSGRGLPCPNISAGYQSGHSIYEYITVQALETTANAIINLAVSFVE